MYHHGCACAISKGQGLTSSSLVFYSTRGLGLVAVFHSESLGYRLGRCRRYGYGFSGSKARCGHPSPKSAALPVHHRLRHPSQAIAQFADTRPLTLSLSLPLRRQSILSHLPATSGTDLGGTRPDLGMFGAACLRAAREGGIAGPATTATYCTVPHGKVLILRW